MSARGRASPRGLSSGKRRRFLGAAGGARHQRRHRPYFLVLFPHGDRLVLLRDGVLVRWTASAASARWQLLRQLVTAGYRRRWLALYTRLPWPLRQAACCWPVAAAPARARYWLVCCMPALASWPMISCRWRPAHSCSGACRSRSVSSMAAGPSSNRCSQSWRARQQSNLLAGVFAIFGLRPLPWPRLALREHSSFHAVLERLAR